MVKKNTTKKKGKTHWKETFKNNKKEETISLRVTPKLRYGLELLSKKQHRSVSSVVTWAIEKAINDTDEGLRKGSGVTLNDLWDVDSADRLVKLVHHSPELLTYEQEKIVKAAKENGWWPKEGESASQGLQVALSEAIIDPTDGSVYFNV
jgi:hypothetical protein